MTVRRAALAAACLACLPAAAPADGWQAYNAGHFGEAVALWTGQAVAGDAQAQFGLGLAYDLGQGVSQDAGSACHWYQRAGDAGVLAATFNAAVMIDQGRCGDRDAALAARWYGRAAAAGYPRAEYVMGQLYESGDGVPRNPAAAAAWYAAAGREGIAAAAHRAGPVASSPAPPAGPASPETPVGETLRNDSGNVPFVWSAPEQPGPVRFYVDVEAVADGLHPVAAQYSERTATMLPLPAGAGQYAWRVFTVSVDGRHYVASEWRRFEVAAP